MNASEILDLGPKSRFLKNPYVKKAKRELGVE